MVRNNNFQTHVIALIGNLEEEEFMRGAIKGSLEDSNKALDKAGFIARLFNAKSLRVWADNKDRCLVDLSERDEKINSIHDEIRQLGYSSDDVMKIREAMNVQTLEKIKRKCSWAELLDEQEQLSLFMDVALEKQGGYSALISLSGYINTFTTDEEKLDFIHGYLPNFKAEGKQTDAYEIGGLFYEAGFMYGIDMRKVLLEYAPQYRHELAFVKLVNDFNYEDARRAMLLEDISKPALAGCSLADMHCNCEESMREHAKVQRKWAKQLKETERSLSVFREKINSYEFYGKVDFLGLGRHGETIVGETLVFNNYRGYQAEVEESYGCGRPIGHHQITRFEYENILASRKTDVA